jgi:hypothetical protein
MKELSEQQLEAGWTEFCLVYRNATHAGVDSLVGLRDAFEAAAEILAERQPVAPDEQAAQNIDWAGVSGHLYDELLRAWPDGDAAYRRVVAAHTRAACEKANAKVAIHPVQRMT